MCLINNSELNVELKIAIRVRFVNFLYLQPLHSQELWHASKATINVILTVLLARAFVHDSLLHCSQGQSLVYTVKSCGMHPLIR